MNCELDHAKYQVPDKEFRCPRCKVDYGGYLPNGERPEDSYDHPGAFVIETSEEGGDDCGLLHNGDELHCGHCGYTTTGKRFSEALKKKAELVTCPCCKGKGTVTKTAAQKFKKG